MQPGSPTSSSLAQLLPQHVAMLRASAISDDLMLCTQCHIPESVKGCCACRLLDHFKPLCPDVSKTCRRLRPVISSKTVKTGAKHAPYQPIGSSQSTLSHRDSSSY